MSDAPEYLDVGGTAAELTALGIPTTERQVYRAFEKRELPAIKLRGRWFARRKALHERLRELEREAR